jgi:Ca2+/Na+ antiporter
MEKEKEFRKKVKRSLRGGSRSNRNHQVPIWSPSSFRNTRETTPLLEASPYSRMTRAFSNPISVGEISFDSIALKAKGGKKKRITREEEKQLIHIATHPEAPDKINVDLRLVQCAHDEMSRRDPWALDVLAIAEDIELEEEAEAYHSQHLLAWPKYGSAGQKIAYVLNFPLHVLITFTIPSGEKFYVLSIVLSVFWLAGISYTLSLCSKNFGNALRINDAVIGLTIDSIGTSLPNLLAAVMAGKRGRSETAICQAFGSNTFDALVAFGLVQFIKSVSVNFEPIQLNAKGIEQNSVINLVLLFLYTWFLYFFRFRLTKAFGATCIFLYSAWLSYQLYLVYSNEEA